MYIKEKEGETRNTQRLHTQHYCTLFIFFRWWLHLIARKRRLYIKKEKIVDWGL